MLSIRENLLETIRGGNPDRFVKQYEFLRLVSGDPTSIAFPRPTQGGPIVYNKWGVASQWPEGQPGAFPIHTPDKVVIKDMAKWSDYVKMPRMDYPDEMWADFEASVDAVNTEEVFCAVAIAPGVFDMTHYLQGMDTALANYYLEPEATKELIELLTEAEVLWGEQLMKHGRGKIDCLFHHDDWGSQLSTFLSPDMFREFILPAYKRIYGWYKQNGIKLIVHHSDSYAATIVPDMIEMGIDIFQGCLTTNDVPKLVKEYGGKISFMGDLNNGVLDVQGWTTELIRGEVERACRTNGKHYFIPCLTAGLPGSAFPGVYKAVSEEIDRMSKEMF